MTSKDSANVLSAIQKNIKDASDRWNSSKILQMYPMLTLSYAQSIDGCIAATGGAALSLSGKQSMKMTHLIRSMHHGILVGVNTVRTDDPALTVRLIEGRLDVSRIRSCIMLCILMEGKSPTPIVLDTNLNCPRGCRLLSHPKCVRPIVLCAKICDPGIAFLINLDLELSGLRLETTRRKLALQELGATILECDTVVDVSTGKRLIQLRHGFEMLRKRGYESVMIEGGAAVITSCLMEEAVAGFLSSIIITIAPIFVGGINSVDRIITDNVGQLLRLEEVLHHQLDNDLVLVGRFRRES